jgi:tryptophan synthase alpha chain
MAATGAPYLYAALRRGITGQPTELGPENLAFLARAAELGLKVLAGFGVERREQVRALGPRAHAVVVGSHFVRAIRQAAAGGAAAVRQAAAAAIRELLDDS